MTKTEKEAPAKPAAKKARKKVTQVNHDPQFPETDEVFWQSDDPYAAGALYTEHGQYKVGDLVVETEAEA